MPYDIGGTRQRELFRHALVSRRGIVASLGGLSALAAASVPLSAQDHAIRAFRDEVLDVLRRHFPDKGFAEGSDEATITYNDPIAPSLHLGNLFASISHVPRGEREDIIVKYFAQALELPTAKAHNKDIAATWEGAGPLLRPRLIPVDYLKTQSSLLHRDFSRDVMIGYSVDLGKFDEFVSEAHASRWGVTIDTIHPTAIANLEELSRNIPIEPKQSGAGVGYFAAVAQRDAYDAVRLLLPGFRTRVMSKLGDFVYAGIPNRDFLVLWSQDFAAHAGFVAQIKRDSQSRPYPLTDEIFVITAAGVRPATSAETTRSP
jgi:uncharacterized protein YtpQ (UPF0354 family)